MAEMQASAFQVPGLCSQICQQQAAQLVSVVHTLVAQALCHAISSASHMRWHDPDESKPARTNLADKYSSSISTAVNRISGLISTKDLASILRVNAA